MTKGEMGFHKIKHSAGRADDFCIPYHGGDLTERPAWFLRRERKRIGQTESTPTYRGFEALNLRISVNWDGRARLVTPQQSEDLL